MKLSQLIAAASVAAAGLVGFAGVAEAAPSPPSACAEGALTIITDDNGVQHEACVASAASSAVVVVERATVGPVPQSTSVARSLPTTGAGTGGLVIAALLVGSGSIVSLLSRRRPVASRKRFRRRNATP